MHHERALRAGRKYLGAELMLVGLLLLWVKSVSVEYVDEAGVLHENFFLIPWAASLSSAA